MIAGFAESAARLDAVWVGAQVGRFPEAWQQRARARFDAGMGEARRIPAGTGKKAEAIRKMNAWLVETAGIVDRVRIPVGISDSELCEKADELARECLNLAGAVWLKTMGAIRARLAQFVGGYGIAQPALPYTTKTGNRAGVEDGPAISRMTDGQWWRRALRRYHARELERAAIALGYVRSRAEIYASTVTVHRRQQQRKRNAAALEQTQAINKDTGEVYSLSELAAYTVANPRIRRGELMTRISGFEAVAAARGDVAEFITLTCPSRFHATRAGGFDNPKHNGETPRQAQRYLTRIWAQARAALHRRGVRPYGFRIAEPHSDGCPHWHVLIFCAALQVGILREVLTRYALKENGSEAGAAENRIKFIRINPSEGSAAGYVAKYVSKNIDGGGYQVQLTLEGGQTIDPSERVEAWASTWGIRQFQQIGGPPVGVWREARRLEVGGEYSDIVEAVRVAADVGPEKEAKPSEGWAAFVRLMGGPNVERKALPVRAARSRDGERWGYAHQAIYQANPTRYGETARGVVFGLSCARGVWPSRRYRWEVKRARAVDGFGGFGGSWTCVNNCTDEGERDGKQSGKFSGSRRVDSRSGFGNGRTNAVFTGRGQKGAAGFDQFDRGHRTRDGTKHGNA